MSYHPCFTGLHVCGKSADEIEPVTVANYPLRRRTAARSAFEQAKRELGDLPADEADLIVDLQERGDCAHTFGIRRQDLPALARIAGEVNELASRHAW